MASIEWTDWSGYPIEVEQWEGKFPKGSPAGGVDSTTLFCRTTEGCMLVVLGAQTAAGGMDPQLAAEAAVIAVSAVELAGPAALRALTKISRR